MRPAETSYRLVKHGEKGALKILAKKYDFSVARFDFPTVVAVRGEKIIGFLATVPTDKAIVAGPLVVDLPVKGPTIMRLVEAYENVLKLAGVSSYVFSIREGDTTYQRMAEKVFDIKPYARKGGDFWYLRHVNGRQSTIGSGAIID